MSVNDRRNRILQLLRKTEKPLSGTNLSEITGVSRQIIVQDINSLKSEGHEIISTARGYMLLPQSQFSRVFKVFHSVSDTQKELNLIVDQGGEIKDVFIFHRVYGEIHGPLNIASRRDAEEFCNDIKSGKSSPLSTATSGYHYHTVLAKDEDTLDCIEAKLKENGFLAELTDYEPSVLSAK